MKREDAEKAAREPVDWLAEGEVETTARPVRMNYSLRMRKGDEALALWLEEEADRRGVNPSDLVRDLCNDARLRDISGQDRKITVRVSELHRLVDTIAEQAA